MAKDILIIDDEADIRHLVSDILMEEKYQTRMAENSDKALKAIAERVPSLVILDIWLQGSELDGLGILELIKQRHPELPVIMISGHGNIETAVSSIKIGAYDFIEKPFNADRLLLVVARALENSKLMNENQELKKRGVPEAELHGDSQAVTQVVATIDKVAATESRILISGVPGTGKEVVARQIHHRSNRAKANFVILSAANITADRLDEALFGVEDTSPAGGAAVLGTFEQAHGGTLFIDEIADMSLETQNKILRTLQHKTFTRVGGNSLVEVDVRLITATNKDLKHEIETGQFREDLYYRLNVVPIHMPRLIERREDIPELCEYFLKKAADTSGVPVRKLSDEAIIQLQSYDWPGNVRQLRNMMERLLIMAPKANGSDVIKADMLPNELFEDSEALSNPEMNSDIMSMPLREARELFEKQYLAAQISRFGGNISKTAQFIGMERSALHRKLKQLELVGMEKAS